MATRFNPAPAQSHSSQLGISEDELELDQAEWQFLRAAKDDLSRKERIRRCFGEIRQEMAHLRSLNTSSSEIRGLMRERIQQFEVAELLIAENSAAYTMKKYEHLTGIQKTAAGIEAARPNFTPFTKKKPLKADESLEERFLQDRAVEHRVPAATPDAGHTTLQEHASKLLHETADTVATLHVVGAHLPKKVNFLGKVAVALGDVLHNPSGPIAETVVCESGVHVLKEAVDVGVAVGVTAALCAELPVSLPVSLAVGAPAVVTTAVCTYRGVQRTTAPAANELKKFCHRSFVQLRDIEAKTSPSETGIREAMRQQSAVNFCVDPQKWGFD